MLGRNALRFARIVSFSVMLMGIGEAATQARSLDRALMATGPGKQIFLAGTYDNAVYIYPESGYFQKPIGKITDGINEPSGLFVDKNGDLYVANLNGGAVSIYHRGAVKPYLVLTGGESESLAVAVDSKGNVYVTGDEPYAIYIYARGATKPTGTLSVEHSPYHLAFDKNDNLFLGGEKEIEEIPAGSTVPHIIDIVTYSSVGAFAIRSDGLLAVAVEHSVIALYAPPYTRQTLKGSFTTGGGDLAGVAFVPGQDLIWISNVDDDAAQAFTFRGKQVGQTSSVGLSYFSGLAVDPAAP